MYQIIDKQGNGKTSRLMLLAKENQGVLVCSNPYAMREKARSYGLTGFDIVSYNDFNNKPDYLRGKKFYIDEIEMYLKYLDTDIGGYSLTVGD